MRVHTIDHMMVEGHVVRFDDLTDEVHVDGEYVGEVLLTESKEYVVFRRTNIPLLHVNTLSNWEEAVRIMALNFIG